MLEVGKQGFYDGNFRVYPVAFAGEVVAGVYVIVEGDFVTFVWHEGSAGRVAEEDVDAFARGVPDDGESAAAHEEVVEDRGEEFVEAIE